MVSELYPVLVEAEAVFGDEARESFDALIKMTNRLWAAIWLYHQGLAQQWKNPSGPNNKYGNIIFGINEFECPNLEVDGKPVDDDNFRRDLDLAMQGIKEYFIPKLDQATPKL